MGKRGPLPRPDHLKAVAGAEERERNRSEPQPGAAVGVDLTQAPRGLGAKPSAVWRRLAPDLVAKRMLTPWDVDMFAAYCIAVVQFNEAKRHVMSRDGGMVTIGSQKQQVVSPYFRAQMIALEAMNKMGAKFGLSPGDRANISLIADTIYNPSGAGPQGQQPQGPERLLS
jgi:P27 family predicted phage terminase small subunit